jgi:predicted metal-dependent peptidase
MLTEKQRLERARIILLEDNCFYGYILMNLELIEDIRIPTACTNGKYIKFNPEFTKQYNDKQLRTLLMHEADHIIYNHHTRRQDRNSLTWNEAGDYVINYDLIYNEHFDMIPSILLDTKFKDMSTEQVYSIIEKEKQNEQNKNNSSDSESNSNESSEGIKDDCNNSNSNSTDSNNDRNGGEDEQGDSNNDNISDSNDDIFDDAKSDIKEYTSLGEVEDLKEGESIQEEEERVREMINEAIIHAEKAGQLSGDMKRKFTELIKPKVPWERIIDKWMQEKFNNDFNFCNRDSRILDYFFPSLESEELGLIIIAIDTSGSINQNLLNRFISEINSLRKKYSFATLLIQCDAKIQFEKKFLKTQEIKFEIMGYGGTDYTPVFKRVEELRENSIGLVYFTDLECYDFGEKPKYDVLWITDNKHGKAPFGKVVQMD